jgi:hypothetical protein
MYQYLLEIFFTSGRKSFLPAAHESERIFSYQARPGGSAIREDKQLFQCRERQISGDKLMST